MCWQAPDSKNQSLWKGGIRKDRSIYIYKYINIYYITFSVSTFGFCKVHFYYCYIMWKTYADLFKGKKCRLCYLKEYFFSCLYFYF